MAKAKRTAGRVITGAVVTAGVALASTSVATADPLSDVQSMISDFQKNPEKFGQDAAKRLENLLGQSGVFSRSAGTEQGTTAVDVNWADLRDLLGNGRDLPADFPEVSQIEMPTELADTLQRSTPQLMALAADQDSVPDGGMMKAGDDPMDQIIELVEGLMEGGDFDFAGFLQDLLNGVNPPENGGGGTPDPTVPDDIDTGAITDGIGPIITKVIDMVTTVVGGGELTSADFQELMGMVSDLLTGAGVDLGDDGDGGSEDEDEDEDGDDPNYLDWTVTLTDPETDKTTDMTVRELMEALGVEVEEPDDGDTGGSDDGDANTGGDDEDDNGGENDSGGSGDNSGGDNNSNNSGDNAGNTDNTDDNGSGGSGTDNAGNGGQDGSGTNEQVTDQGGIGGDGGAEQPQAQNPNERVGDNVPPPTYNDAAADSLPVTGASSATPWMAGIAGLAVLSGLALLFGSRWRVSKGV